MPIHFNEPLSCKNCATLLKKLRKKDLHFFFLLKFLVLQRLTEFMEYSYLLNKASEATDPAERMQVSSDSLGIYPWKYS